jgi:hypothetical protein
VKKTKRTAREGHWPDPFAEVHPEWRLHNKADAITWYVDEFVSLYEQGEATGHGLAEAACSYVDLIHEAKGRLAMVVSAHRKGSEPRQASRDHRDPHEIEALRQELNAVKRLLVEELPSRTWNQVRHDRVQEFMSGMPKPKAPAAPPVFSDAEAQALSDAFE